MKLFEVDRAKWHQKPLTACALTFYSPGGCGDGLSHSM